MDPTRLRPPRPHPRRLRTRPSLSPTNPRRPRRSRRAPPSTAQAGQPAAPRRAFDRLLPSSRGPHAEARSTPKPARLSWPAAANRVAGPDRGCAKCRKSTGRRAGKRVAREGSGLASPRCPARRGLGTCAGRAGPGWTVHTGNASAAPCRPRGRPVWPGRHSQAVAALAAGWVPQSAIQARLRLTSPQATLACSEVSRSLA